MVTSSSLCYNDVADRRMCGSRGGIGGLDPPGKSQVIWVSIEISI